MTSIRNNEKSKRKFILGKWKILVPVLIGLTIASWMLYRAITDIEYYRVASGEGQYEWVDSDKNNIVDFNNDADFVAMDNGNYSRRTFGQAMDAVQISGTMVFFLFLAVLMMVVRDFGYMMRIRTLTDKQLSWKQSFRVIMIWEFASAITPGIVGGATVAMFILHREGINLGRSTAIVLITALLDELFYVLIVPVILLLVGTTALFPPEMFSSFFGVLFNPFTLFFISFFIILGLVLFLLIVIFIAPFWFKNVLLFFSRLFFLKRYRERMSKTGDDIILASKELKGKPYRFWLSAFGATVLSWMGRFMVINCIILAFAPFADQLLVFARQMSMWVILLISPTPGGSGIAEVAFSGFLKDFIPFGMVAILAILWRLISYYPYLFIGAVILPKWLGNKA